MDGRNNDNDAKGGNRMRQARIWRGRHVRDAVQYRQRLRAVAGPFGAPRQRVVGRWALCVAAFGFSLAGFSARAAPPTPKASFKPGVCSVGSLQSAAPAGATVESAYRTTVLRGYVASTYCNVAGSIRLERPGPYVVRFNLALPDRFDGRFLMTSQGGAAGMIVEPDPRRLAEGFAVASTDKGSGAQHPLDFSFMGDAGRALNYDHRGNHVTAVTTQALTRAYYGAARLRRYIAGCSGGGIAGANSIRNYAAEDYDGVIIGSPPYLSMPTLVGQWGYIMSYVARKPSSWIPPERLKAAEAAIIRRYDMADGVRDGMIADDRLVDFDPGVLRGAGLTEDQVQLFMRIISPWEYGLTSPPTRFGGFSIAVPSSWTAFLGTTPPPWGPEDPGRPRYLVVVESALRALTGDPKADIAAFHLSRLEDQRKLLPPSLRPAEPIPEMRVTSAEAPDTRRFRDQGGKVIHFYGMADNAVNVSNGYVTEAEMLRQENGGQAALDRWARFYFVPDMLHCEPQFDGPGPDDVQDRLLPLLIDWVEKGVPPGPVVASRDDRSRSFLLCPSPQVAVLRAPGASPNDAANWTCRAGR